MRNSALKRLMLVLKESGAKDEDINTALALKEKIEEVDKLVFPDNPCWVRISHRPSVDTEGYEGALACCNFGLVDFYTIFAPDLDEAVKEIRDNTVVFVENSNNGFDPMRPNEKLPIEAVMVAIAAHEIRHRIQKREKPLLFKPMSAKKFGSDIVANVRYMTKLIFNDRKEQYRSQGKSRNHSRIMTNSREVDANVVGMLALHIYIRNNSLEDVATTVRFGVKDITA
jgi:hypothetical protein